MKRAVLILAAALMCAGCATKRTRELETSELAAQVSVRSAYASTDSLLRLRHMELDSLSVTIERDSLGERITLRARRAVLADSSARVSTRTAERCDTTSVRTEHREVARSDVRRPRLRVVALLLAVIAAAVIWLRARRR